MARNSVAYDDDFYAWTMEQARLLRSGELSQLDSWAMKTALKVQELSPAMRQTVDGLLDALSKR